MLDPYRLSLSVEDASGRVSRWGPDEPDGRDVPQDLEFGTALPGGYTDLRCSLLREFTRANADNNLLDRVRAQAPGGETAFDGFFTSFPKQLAQAPSVDPAAIGWSGLFMFDTGFQRLYVDRELARWGPVSRARRKALVDAGRIYFDPSLGVDAVSGLPAVIQTLEGERTGTVFGMAAEAMYDAGPGQTIAAIYYDVVWALATGATSVYDATYVVQPHVWQNDDRSGTVVDGTDHMTGTVGGSAAGYFTPGTPLRYGVLEYDRSGVGFAGHLSNATWRQLAVYGNHGLTRRGSDPGGFYNCDIVADIVRNCAPRLNFTTGAGGSIEPNTQLVSHLVFREPTKGADALARASAFGIDAVTLPEWGVYNDLQFFWRSPNPDRLCWQARLSDGAKPRFEGEQSDDRFNGVLVSFTDPAGVQRYVGPPAAYWNGGVALADATDAGLVDTSPTNPLNAHALGPKWARLNLTQTATTAGAIALGTIFLALQSQPQRRGQIELSGLVKHPTKAQRQPAYLVKAGDYVQIPDSAESDVKRRIISTRYSHQTRSLVADVDNTPFTLDALLEAMQADLVGVL